MPQSLTNVLVHIVFSTKDRYGFLAEPALRDDMHAYLGGASRAEQCPCLVAGGTADHVHLLCLLHKTVAVATLIRDIKRASSSWIKARGGILTKFAWQNGYGAFSVSQSNVRVVREYIEGQEEHHRTHTFQEEFRAFLARHEIECDERYVWE